jgi:phosphoribosylglycinamide formyltransferase-1
MATTERPRIAILASGNGSIAEAYIKTTQLSRVEAEVGLVICNNPPEEAEIYERIERLNQVYGLDIEMAHISSRTHPDAVGEAVRGQTTMAEAEAICEKLSDGGFAHVALMGYLKKVRGPLVEEWGWRPNLSSIYKARMTNSHPGPLPETAGMYGLDASERVLELGLTASKHTVHLVAEAIDQGPILAVHDVKIEPDDSAQMIFDNVQRVERELLPFDIDHFLHGQAIHRAA